MSANRRKYSGLSMRMEGFLEAESSRHEVIGIRKGIIKMCCPQLNAALLLSQMIYWTAGRLRVERGGYLWIAKSREEWSGDTCLTFEQVKDALSFLKKNRLIISEQHLFGTKSVSHIRIDLERLEKHLLDGEPLPLPVRERGAAVVPNGIPQVVPNGTTQVVPESQSVGSKIFRSAPMTTSLTTTLITPDEKDSIPVDNENSSDETQMVAGDSSMLNKGVEVESEQSSIVAILQESVFECDFPDTVELDTVEQVRNSEELDTTRQAPASTPPETADTRPFVVNPNKQPAWFRGAA
jgi:hypothetical protein